jgi:hypothetical protein
MSFQTYIENIKIKTGKTPEEIKALAEKSNILVADMKATEFCNWLKDEFALGHGHSMALWALFISNGWIETKNSTMSKSNK